MTERNESTARALNWTCRSTASCSRAGHKSRKRERKRLPWLRGSTKENTENHHPRSALTMSPALARSNGVLEISHMVLTAVLWSVGLAAVIMGSLLLTDSRMSGLQTLRHFGPLQSASILVVVIGVLVIVLGIIGCLGVNARSRPLLLIFSFFLVCHMILEIACCILTWYYKRGTTVDYDKSTRAVQAYKELPIYGQNVLLKATTQRRFSRFRSV